MIFHYRCPRRSCRRKFIERAVGPKHVATFCACDGGTRMVPDGIVYDQVHPNITKPKASGEHDESTDA